MPLNPDQLARILAVVPLEHMESLQIVTAAALADQYYPRLDPAQPVLILGITDAAQPTRLRQVLSQAYTPEHPLILLGGTTGRETSLAALADIAAGGDALLVPPLAAPASYEALQDVVAHLRAPAGCPWDRALTWDKLRATLLEETYELLAALAGPDPGERIFGLIEAEHRRTREWHARITASDDLLADNPALARSIANRFPYLDPLHVLQVEMLRRYREGDEDEMVVRALELTLNAIATGLRNSG